MDIDLFINMLDNLYSQLEYKKEYCKIILPEPLLIKSGKKTIWKNTHEFLNLFNRESDDFINFVNKETTSHINWISDNKLAGCIFNNVKKKDYIYELMKQYINSKIMCKCCNSLNTSIYKNIHLRKYNFKCNNCNNEIYI